VKIKEDFGSSGWSFVGQAETGFDPFSFQLANGPGAIYENNLVNLPYQSSSGDSARAGQPFNSQLFAGVSNSTFGTLTWGRENTLLLDGVNGYDPMGGSYAFSVIGFSGTTAGGGNTEDTRSNTAFKYRGTYNNFRVGALVQTGGYEQDNGADQIYQGQFGFDLYNFSFDAIGSYAVDSDHLGTLDGSTSFTPTKYPAGTLDAVSATISNDTSIMLLGKYVWNQLTWYGGFEDIKYANPTSNWAIGTSSSPSVNNFFTGIGGYLAVNKGDAFYTPEYFQVYWTGLKYAFTPDLVGSVAYYHYNQEFYQSSAKSIASCNSSAHGNCAGTLDAVSALIDYRFGFAQKFDVYAGAMFSQVNDGLAAGYQTGGHVNIDPTVGLRFRF